MKAKDKVVIVKTPYHGEFLQVGCVGILTDIRVDPGHPDLYTVKFAEDEMGWSFYRDELEVVE